MSRTVIIQSDQFLPKRVSFMTLYAPPCPYPSLEFEHVSATKNIQIQGCKQSNPDDIFNLVKVYPNPTEDAFEVDILLIEATNFWITLSDINGGIIENRLLEDNSLNQIGFSGVGPGVYFVKIHGESKP